MDIGIEIGSDYNPHQEEIKFFWPLTEQIPLDLGYSNVDTRHINSLGQADQLFDLDVSANSLLPSNLTHITINAQMLIAV